MNTNKNSMETDNNENISPCVVVPTLKILAHPLRMVALTKIVVLFFGSDEGHPPFIL